MLRTAAQKSRIQFTTPCRTEQDEDLHTTKTDCEDRAREKLLQIAGADNKQGISSRERRQLDGVF